MDSSTRTAKPAQPAQRAEHEADNSYAQETKGNLTLELKFLDALGPAGQAIIDEHARNSPLAAFAKQALASRKDYHHEVSLTKTDYAFVNALKPHAKDSPDAPKILQENTRAATGPSQSL